MVCTRLTPVGILFLGLMLLFYVASVTSQSGLLLLLIGLKGGCFIVNWSFSRRNARHVQVTPPRDCRLVEGDPPTQPWLIENKSSRHAELVEVFNESGVLFRLPAMRCRHSAWLLPTLVYQRRGVYPHSCLTISSAAPFGLLRSTRKLLLEGELLVLPRVYKAESPAAGGFDLMAGGRFRGSRRVHTGSHFAGVRAWQSGDSLKQVHWKTTARLGELMVKTFEEELGGRLSLILDCAASNDEAIDNAVRAASSLAVATLQQGQHLEFCASADTEFLRLTPFSDEGDLLEMLARFVPNPSINPPALTQLWRKSTVALVGTEWRPAWQELIEDAQRQNRKVFLYLPEGALVPRKVEIHPMRFNASEILAGAENSALIS